MGRFDRRKLDGKEPTRFVSTDEMLRAFSSQTVTLSFTSSQDCPLFACRLYFCAELAAIPPAAQVNVDSGSSREDVAITLGSRCSACRCNLSDKPVILVRRVAYCYSCTKKRFHSFSREVCTAFESSPEVEVKYNSDQIAARARYHEELEVSKALRADYDAKYEAEKTQFGSFEDLSVDFPSGNYDCLGTLLSWGLIFGFFVLVALAGRESTGAGILMLACIVVVPIAFYWLWNDMNTWRRSRWEKQLPPYRPPEYPAMPACLVSGKDSERHFPPNCIVTLHERTIDPALVGTGYDRGKILSRDNYTCQCCGEKFSAGELEVHHILPRAKDGSDSPHNLVSLCETCHIDERWFGHFHTARARRREARPKRGRIL